MSDVDDAEDVPMYDEDDPEGDRRPYLDDPAWIPIQELFDDEPDEQP